MQFSIILLRADITQSAVSLSSIVVPSMYSNTAFTSIFLFIGLVIVDVSIFREEEALHTSIVPTISFPAHTLWHLVFSKQFAKFSRAVLIASVTMEYDAFKSLRRHSAIVRAS